MADMGMAPVASFNLSHEKEARGPGVIQTFKQQYQDAKRRVTSPVQMMGQPRPDKRQWSPYGRGQNSENRWPGGQGMGGGGGAWNAGSTQAGICSSCQTPITASEPIITNPNGTQVCSACYQSSTVIPNTDKPLEAFNAKKRKTAIGIGIQQTQITVNPNLLALFRGDEDAMHDFIESMHSRELCIMNQHGHDKEVLRRLILKVRGDVDGTAKDLEMDG